MIKSLSIFLLAAFCEVGGGYLVWLYIKDNKNILFGIAGVVLLTLYAIVATLQNQSFGRVYAAYGGIFIVFSLFWAMGVDHFKPDKWDIIGASIALMGVLVIMYAPR